jgi:hypothetical protein
MPYTPLTMTSPPSTHAHTPLRHPPPQIICLNTPPVGLNGDHGVSEPGLLWRCAPNAPLLPLRGTPAAAPPTNRPPVGVPALLLAADASESRCHRMPGSGLGFEARPAPLPFSESSAAQTSSISSEGKVAICSCLLLLLRPGNAPATVPERWLLLPWPRSPSGAGGAAAVADEKGVAAVAELRAVAAGAPAVAAEGCSGEVLLLLRNLREAKAAAELEPAPLLPAVPDFAPAAAAAGS